MKFHSRSSYVSDVLSLANPTDCDSKLDRASACESRASAETGALALHCVIDGEQSSPPSVDLLHVTLGCLHEGIVRLSRFIVQHGRKHLPVPPRPSIKAEVEFRGLV